MSDLIKREDAIKALMAEAKEQFRLDPSYAYVIGALRNVEDAIRNIPSADRPQEWIPCSERMPDLEEYVLVALRYGERMIMTLDWDDGKIEWKTQEKSIIYDDEEVIAWMPLPKPWKGASR